MLCPYCKKEIEPVEETTPEISVIKDEKGRLKTWTEVTKDLEGTQIQKRIDEYSYYPSGEINIIMQTVYGPIDRFILEENEIQHFKDGRQPTCSIIKQKGDIIL